MQKIILNDMKWQRLRTQGCFIIKKLLKKIKYVFYKKVKSFVKKTKACYQVREANSFFFAEFSFPDNYFSQDSRGRGRTFLIFLRNA